jgi:glycosyltransferase involved in cell wall biosynthesis
MNTDLAIIIPAYKDIFLRKTLSSLASQTCKDFMVYIGDDNSPNDLKTICNDFNSKLNIEYTKFPNNIGARNIIRQWERCIDLSKNENWIWLFSDDDIADPCCVEVFLKTINKDNEKFDVYRFNTRVIDDEDHVIAEPKESPFIESSINMAYSILLGERGNSMPDHIFSRKIYNELGFVHTDFAQSADWGTSISFAFNTGICTMSGAKVNWRCGNYNISGLASTKKVQMFKGYIQFLIWFINFYQSMDNEKKGGYTYNDIKNATEINLRKIIEEHYKGISILNTFDVFHFYMVRDKSCFLALKNTLKTYLYFNHFFNTITAKIK